MSATNHLIKHIGLHRLNGVELRTISDLEEGVLPIIEAERTVIVRLAQESRWQQRMVTLFVLSDLTPLTRQLQALGRDTVDAQPGTRGELSKRPVVNVYDLASPAACHVFVNRTAMIEAGYWDDPTAIQGLLAHEHAHPLAECPATGAVRRLQIDLTLQAATPWAQDAQQAQEWTAKAQNQLTALAHSLVLLGPREVLANQMVLEVGFAPALWHLNRQTIRTLAESVGRRPLLQALLSDAVAAGRLNQTGADALLLIGDLQGCLLLSTDIAAFQRQGCDAEADELLAHLHAEVFPHLDPLVERLFQQFCETYVQLSPSAVIHEIRRFAQGQLDLLATTLAKRFLHLTSHVTISPPKGG